MLKRVFMSRSWFDFRNAIRTLIWLGEADEDRDLVVDSMRSLTEKLSKVDREQARGPYFRPRNIFNIHGLPDKDDAVCKALVALKQRPWFSRLWTLQEAILAQDPVIVCGSWSVPWSALPLLLATALRAGFAGWLNADANVLLGGGMVLRIEFQQEIRRTGLTSPSLPLNIRDSTCQTCTEPVDRLWALLGL
jgi:Heterokaryon incompatibility protein (HET)